MGLILATRRSPLALVQARAAAAHVQAAAGRTAELLPLSTTGDERRDWSLAAAGGKGLFTAELERAVLAGEATAAVHSAKDLPTELPEGLVIAGYLPRADPRDVLVVRAGLERPRVLATGSPRRRRQAELLFPGVEFVEIRGNVDTRLRKVAEGAADGTFLAAAGLARLGIGAWPGLEFRPLEVAQMVPAAGQAAIAIECREADAAWLGSLLDAPTCAAVTLERAVLAALGGGCQASAAVHAASDGVLWVHDERRGRLRGPWFDVSGGVADLGAWPGKPFEP